MKRGWAVRRAGFWKPATAIDRVVLDAGDRHRRRIMLKGDRGTEFLLDLDEAGVADPARYQAAHA